MNGMSGWARKWWPGLVPLAILWIVAIWHGTAPLEANLAARSTAALKGTVLDKTRISVSGRDVTLSAEAFSEDGRRSATSQVEAVPGVKQVDVEMTFQPQWGMDMMSDEARLELGFM